MGKTDEALKKAETEFLKKFGKNNNRQEACKPCRQKNAYIGLLALGLLTLIIAGYIYDRRVVKPTAADFKELRNAKTRIAQLDKTLTLKNHKLVELENRLSESEKNIKEVQITRESHRAELVTKKIMDRRVVKPTAADSEELRSAKTRIAQLDETLTLKNHKLGELEKRLYESEKNIKEEQIARESQRAELVTKRAMVTMLQEKLKTAQSRQLHLKDEVANSKIRIQALQVQLSAIKKKIDSAKTPSPVFQAPKKRLEAAPSFNLQKDSKPDKSDQQADAWDPGSLSTTPDVAYNEKAVSTAESDPSTAKGQSPDPAKIIDWLLKKQPE